MDDMVIPYPLGKREVRLFIFVLICCGWLVNSLLFGGAYLGFAIGAMGLILIVAGYLLAGGCKLNFYSGALLTMSLVIAASFTRSNDAGVKLVMVLFLVVSGGLGLCLLAGQNRRDPAGVGSLLDAPRAVLRMSFGSLLPTFSGMNEARKAAGSFGKKQLAFLGGLAVTIPVLAILIALLIRADAAFEGLLQQLPSVELSEPILTLLWGAGAGCLAFSMAVGLKHADAPIPAETDGKRFSPVTVNTVLISVCAVYCVYLFSQLAYFSGGFSQILPADFTMAEYARRGFFEMAWIMAINLTIMALGVGLVERSDDRAPLLTRCLCLFIGLVTLFFVVTASAKMWMYIGSYGLTRLRVLTQIIMVFLGLTTVIVSLWLFLPKLPYMKLVVLTALVIGAVTVWVDVDTVVGAYNVSAYQSGRLDHVDVWYLSGLSDGVVPYLHELTADPDPDIAQMAQAALKERSPLGGDIRDFHIAGAIARNLLNK